MQVEMNETVNMKMEASLLELLVEIDPKLYSKYLSNKNGRLVLYVRLKMSLYGTLMACLFWRILTEKFLTWVLRSTNFTEVWLTS